MKNARDEPKEFARLLRKARRLLAAIAAGPDDHEAAFWAYVKARDAADVGFMLPEQSALIREMNAGLDAARDAGAAIRRSRREAESRRLAESIRDARRPYDWMR